MTIFVHINIYIETRLDLIYEPVEYSTRNHILGKVSECRSLGTHHKKDVVGETAGVARAWGQNSCD